MMLKNNQAPTVADNSRWSLSRDPCDDFEDCSNVVSDDPTPTAAENTRWSLSRDPCADFEDSSNAVSGDQTPAVVDNRSRWSLSRDPCADFEDSSHVVSDDDTTSASRQKQLLFVPEESIGDGKAYPQSQEDADVVDRTLAEEMENLTTSEHEKLIFEVHGLPSIDDGEPADFASALSELDLQLEKILCREENATTASIKAAASLRPEYVNDEKFRIMFLRAERFDAELAAEKMVKHFRTKEELFGSGEILGRDVTMSDLSDLDVSVLESGMFQFLPIRDAGGRFVYAVRPEVYYTLKGGVSVENIARARWYIWMAMLKDEELQKGGMVVIMNMIEMANGLLPIAKELRMGRDAIPKRTAAVHFCYDNKSRPWMSAHKLYFMRKGTRARMRAHYVDDYGEAIFNLQTYGIPVAGEHFPADGSVYKKWHLEWMAMRKRQEVQSDMEKSTNATKSNNIGESRGSGDSRNNGTEDNIIVPGRHDVLFGKGKKMTQHTGNITCNHLIEENQEKYEGAGKFEKTDIAEGIVTSIHECGGRFLKWDKTEGWEEVDRLVAREKISHSFRRMRNKSPARPTSSSSPKPKRVPVRASEEEHKENSGRTFKQIRKEDSVQ